jgi:hypothetical protein
VSRDRVMVAILHGAYEPLTVGALNAMTAYDLRVGGGHLNHNDYFLQVGTTDIASGRNTAVRDFLASDAEWLLFLDSDQVWNPDLVDRLYASADVDERPIVSGLIMAHRPERDLPVSPACGIFDDSDEPQVVAPPFIPNVRWWRVATVGAGCLFIHRRVLEAIRTKFEEQYSAALWFDQLAFRHVDADGESVMDRMGEDYVFSARASACGFPLIVDTTIELGHIKRVTFTREMFHQQMAQRGLRPLFVVIPVKDKLDLTESLIGQLREQGGYDGLFVFDNGSGAATKEWLKHQPDVLSWDAKGAGIHHMWNAGVDEALRRSGGRCDIVFLNNDLKLGHDFCAGLQDALGSGPWVAVSANYDGRTGEPVEQVHGICAERYDGTGGLAGFAFAVRSEWFAQYRFPTDCKWWYGDNDLTLSMDVLGAPYGIATQVAVEHLGAGTAGDWADKKWSAQLEADRAAFARKWAQVGASV